MARVGERLKIAKLKGSESTMHRLISLGLVPGTNVQNSSISGCYRLVTLQNLSNLTYLHCS
ncbi:MAG: ferrous iron transport protein A [Cyanobacteria bacterium P01_A01_bin.68]